jgi:electron transport complex protein RnfB
VKRTAVALVDESRCIGCTLCIDACPVDAIVGAAQLMHTVIESWCIGCRLCVPPCPVDCIAMVPPRGEWSAQLRRDAGRRGRERKRRLERRAIAPAVTDRRKVLERILKKRE